MTECPRAQPTTFPRTNRTSLYYTFDHIQAIAAANFEISNQTTVESPTTDPDNNNVFQIRRFLPLFAFFFCSNFENFLTFTIKSCYLRWNWKVGILILTRRAPCRYWLAIFLIFKRVRLSGKAFRK